MEVKSTGKPYQQFKTGSQRDSDEGKSRPDLVDPFFIDRVGEHLRKGAGKYGEWNWYKGQPTSRSAASLKRHIQLWEMGHVDEDHLAAVAFGIMNIWRAERLAEAHPEQYGYLLDAIHYQNNREAFEAESARLQREQIKNNDCDVEFMGQSLAASQDRYYLTIEVGGEWIDVEVSRTQYDELIAKGLRDTTGGRMQAYVQEAVDEEIVEAEDGPAEIDFNELMVMIGGMAVEQFQTFMSEMTKQAEELATRVEKFLAVYGDGMRDEELAYDAIVDHDITGEDPYVIYQRLRVEKYPGNDDPRHPDEWAGEGCTCGSCTEARQQTADRKFYEAKLAEYNELKAKIAAQVQADLEAKILNDLDKAGAFKPEVEPKSTVYDRLFPEFDNPFYGRYNFGFYGLRPLYVDRDAKISYVYSNPMC